MRSSPTPELTRPRHEYRPHPRNHATTMTGKLARVGFNELLDSVRPDHAASPNLPAWILASNVADAAWRFNLTRHQHSMSERGPHHSSWSSTQEEL
ncbi:MAG TPA: hypothetical protein VFQ47_02090 [Nitrososphaera sp.]|nr:hypothetical protein [Nitrososphaera sp.]